MSNDLAERVIGLEETVRVCLQSVIAVIAIDEPDRAVVMCELVRDQLRHWAAGQGGRLAMTTPADFVALAADRLGADVRARLAA